MKVLFTGKPSGLGFQTEMFDVNSICTVIQSNATTDGGGFQIAAILAPYPPEPPLPENRWLVVSLKRCVTGTAPVDGRKKLVSDAMTAMAKATGPAPRRPNSRGCKRGSDESSSRGSGGFMP